jgi:hypothetical protein
MTKHEETNAGEPLALRLTEGLGVAEQDNNIAAPPSEWTSVPGCEQVTDATGRQIVAVVLAGRRAARVQWVLTVPGESGRSPESHAAVASTGLFFLGVECLRRGAVAMWRRATSRLGAR